MTLPTSFPDGRRFPSFSQAAAAEGLSPSGLLKRRAKQQPPFSISESTPLRGVKLRKQCFYRGRRYGSRAEAAQACGVSLSAVYRELRRQRESV